MPNFDSGPVTTMDDLNETRDPVLRLTGLHVGLVSGDAIVENVDLTVQPGQILGLVGESGSGKTTSALSLLGYARDSVEIRDGVLDVAGARMRMDESMRPARGSVIAYVPQDPSRALNPSLRIGAAIEETVRSHARTAVGDDLAPQMLDKVGLPSSPEFLGRFPHQLSGGQQQRVAIAMALACDPADVVLDEPTTGLDVVTQAKILAELSRLREEGNIAMVYVTHDLAVVGQIADRIAVMYAGRIVEHGPSEEVLQRPRHPYTRGLLASVPDHVRPRVLEPMPGVAVAVGERPQGCSFAPRCPQGTQRCAAEVPPLSPVGAQHEARCVHGQQTPRVNTLPLVPRERRSETTTAPLLRVESLGVEHRSRQGRVRTVDDVSFTVERGACVALVGESGSGKTTIARAIAGLHPITDGRIVLDGNELSGLIRRRRIDQRRDVQLVAQNPADALNPRHTIAETIGRPARLLRSLRRAALSAEVDRQLECVRLPSRVADRYPRELSGGERQRVAIARALAAGPRLLLCDEVTSALDVSVQAATLKLLSDLRDDLGLSLLFITHDLGVVATVADQVLVLERGRICERGPAIALLRQPEHPYTRSLVGAAPSLTGASDGVATGEQPTDPRKDS
jgi:peptide/nickel transport system ATP-binding protein